MFIAAFIAVLALLFAFGWAPDFGAIWNAALSGGKTLIVTPLTDAGVLLRRAALVVVAILLLALALPVHATTSGSYSDLKASIEAYQSTHGLRPDGIWGNNTNKMYLSGQ